MSSIVPKNVATMSANAPTQMPMSLQKRLELSPAVDGDRPSSNVAVASAAPVAEAFEEGVAPYVSLEGMTRSKSLGTSGVTPRDSDDRAGESVAKLRGWRGARDSDRKKTHAAKPVERPVDSTTGSFAVRGAVRGGARRVRHATLQGFVTTKK